MITDLLKESRTRVLTLRADIEGLRDAIPDSATGTRQWLMNAIEALTYASACTHEASRELERGTTEKALGMIQAPHMAGG